MFKLLPDTTAQSLTVVVNGKALTVPHGFTAAAAMLLQDEGPTRTTALSGEGRAPYCMMGVCFECLMVIDGVPSRQACTRSSSDQETSGFLGISAPAIL